MLAHAPCEGFSGGCNGMSCVSIVPTKSSLTLHCDSHVNCSLLCIWICRRIISVSVWAGTSFLFIPVYRILLQAYHCRRGDGDTLRLVPDPSVGCWAGTHIIYVVCASVALALFTLTSLRLVPVLGRLADTAVFFWFDWSFDKPDTSTYVCLKISILISPIYGFVRQPNI
jgi:hypothetical protein